MRRPWTTRGCRAVGKKSEEEEMCVRVFVVSLEGMRPTGINKCMGENNIKYILKM
jgi:hypothetical protein